MARRTSLFDSLLSHLSRCPHMCLNNTRTQVNMLASLFEHIHINKCDTRVLYLQLVASSTHLIIPSGPSLDAISDLHTERHDRFTPCGCSFDNVEYSAGKRFATQTVEASKKEIIVFCPDYFCSYCWIQKNL